MTVVIVVSIALVFVLSLAEGAWWTLKIEEVVKCEGQEGASSRTDLLKELLRERMVAVNWTLFLLDICLFLGAFALGLLVSHRSPWEAVIVSTIYPLVRFLLGEVVSKNMGYNHRLKVCLYSVYFLNFFLKFIFPVTWLLQKLDKWTGGKRRVIGEEDVVAAARAAGEHGSIYPVEVRIITRFLAIGNKRVKELMIPLADCKHITSTTTIGHLLDVFGSRKEKPVAVDDSKTGRIIGILTAKTTLSLINRDSSQKDSVNLSVVGKDTVCLREDDEISKIFEALSQKPVGLVKDAAGRIIGIITWEMVESQYVKTK